MSVRHTSFSEVTLIKEFFTKTKIGKKLFSEHYQPYGWLCTNRNNTFLDKKYCRTCERNSKYPIIHCIKWWIDNTVIVRRINWVWFRTKRFQRIYASNLYALVLTIFMFENSSWMRHVPFPSFTHRKISTSISIKKFLLCSAWIWHLLQAIHDVMTISTFEFFCRGVLQF